MDTIISIFFGLLILFLIMFLAGKCFESDLKDLEKTNPKYRKHLKEKYKI